MNYTPDNTPYKSGNYYQSEKTFDLSVSNVMKQVFLKMFLGLLVSGLVAWWCASTPAVLHTFATNSWLMWVLFFAELGLVIGITSNLQKLSPGMASTLFYVFAVVNGVMLFPIIYAYTLASIAKTFFICAGTFGAMSVYGYLTSNDLTKFGTYLVYALIGVIIATLVNIFTHSSTMEWIISGAGILIFLGLTAWDTQTIKRMVISSPAEWHGKIATYGALSLYLDFINLFLYLLRFFGNNRN